MMEQYRKLWRMLPMAEKKKILYIVEAMGGGVFTYIVDLANELVNSSLFCMHQNSRSPFVIIQFF